MSLTEGFIVGTSTVVLGSAGLAAFAMWICVQDERRQEKEAAEAEHEAFRKEFTIHQP